jgi:protease I
VIAVSDELHQLRVAFVVANEGIEESELAEPWGAVLAAGGRPELVAPHPGRVQAVHHLDRTNQFAVDRVTEDARAGDYDAVVLPGGVLTSDLLRQDAAAVDFIMAMFEQGKPVAAICQGAQTLVDGALVEGRTVTSWPALQTDMRNAGATWVDQEVAVCRHGINTLVTSRRTEDLTAFCRAMTEVFAEAC